MNRMPIYLLIVSIGLNLYFAYRLKKDRPEALMISNLSLKLNTKDSIEYAEGYIAGSQKAYQYYKSPTYYPSANDPMYKSDSAFDEGFVNGVKITEKKCDDAMNLKVENEQLILDMLHSYQEMYAECNESLKQFR